MLKLNLGCRVTELHQSLADTGWTFVDIAGAHITIDLRNFPWPFEDNSVDAILASHILEHCHKDVGKQFIVECYRILKPGGVISIAVPDHDAILNASINGFDAIDGQSLIYLGVPAKHLRENEADRPNLHCYVYSFESLAYPMEKAGFERVTRQICNESAYEVLRGGIQTEMYKNLSLYVEGRKPDEDTPC